MSIAATQYITSGGKDLSSIFMPLSFGTQYPTETGYKLSTGADLNTVFCSKYSTTAQNPPNQVYEVYKYDKSSIIIGLNNGAGTTVNAMKYQT